MRYTSFMISLHLYSTFTQEAKIIFSYTVFALLFEHNCQFCLVPRLLFLLCPGYYFCFVLVTIFALSWLLFLLCPGYYFRSDQHKTKLLFKIGNFFVYFFQRNMSLFQMPHIVMMDNSFWIANRRYSKLCIMYVQLMPNLHALSRKLPRLFCTAFAHSKPHKPAPSIPRKASHKSILLCIYIYYIIMPKKGCHYSILTPHTIVPYRTIIQF